MLHNQHSSVHSQLDRLERISNQISLLISNNDYERISHLDRMRKKIITDMKEKNLELSTNHKKSVLKQGVFNPSKPKPLTIKSDQVKLDAPSNLSAKIS